MNKKSIQLLAPFFLKRWKLFLAFGILSLLVSGLDFGILSGGARLFDQFIQGKALAPLSFAYAALLAGAYLCVEIFRATQNYIYTSTSNGIYCELQDVLVQKTLSAPYLSFRTLATGDILKRLFKDAEKVAFFAGSVFSLLFKEPIRILFFSALLLYWSPLLFLGLCAGLIGVSGFSYLLSKSIVSVCGEENKKEAQLYQRAQKILQNWSLIKAFRMEGGEAEKWSLENAELFQLKKRSLLLYLCHRIGFRLAFVLGLILFFFLLPAKPSRFFSNSAEWVRVAGVVFFLAQSVRRFSSDALNLIDEKIRADILLQIVGWPEERKKKTQIPRQKELTQIVVEELHFSYDGKKEFFQGLHFELAPGKPLILNGPNGSGKTTLAYLLLSFLEPSSGKVLFNGVDNRQIDPAWLRSRCGVIFQQPFVIEATLHENLYYGLNGRSRKEADDVLEFVGLNHLLPWQEQGKPFGETWRELSFGEKQKLALARAFLHDPDFLILDEATSAVDPESEKRILEELFKKRQHKMTLAIFHRQIDFDAPVSKRVLGSLHEISLTAGR